MQTLVKKLQEFNITRSFNLFEEIMNTLYPNANKCKDCGKHILYYDTIFGGFTRKSRKTGKCEIYLAGKSFLTKKTHGETLQVCESCLKEKFSKYKHVRSFNIISDITVYAFNIQDRSKYFTGSTKKICIKKYGKEEGTKRWNEYCKKQAETNTFEYKSKKYGMTLEEFNSFNKSRAVTLENLIKKHGKELGEEKWNIYIERQKETKSLDYMIKKFGEEKTNQINGSKALTLNNFIKKYGDETGTEKFIKLINRQRSFYSKISQKCFSEIDKKLQEKYMTYYASKNIEYGILLSIGYVKLDYFIKELNLCIEFNGDIFHANPKLYKENDHPNPYCKELTAKEIWKNDKIRYEILKKERNIDTLIIWESDYKTLNINKFVNNNILNR